MTGPPDIPHWELYLLKRALAIVMFDDELGYIATTYIIIIIAS